MVTSVVEALERDLVGLGDRRLAESALAASALSLAVELDDPSNSATSKSMCARALMETLNRLRELAPEEQQADLLDDLASKRQTRLRKAAS